MTGMLQLIDKVGKKRTAFTLNELKHIGHILISNRDTGWWCQMEIGAGDAKVTFDTTKPTFNECAEEISRQLFDFIGVK